MPDSNYYTKLFIHDSLARRAAAMSAHARKEWGETFKLRCMAVSWPSEPVRTDDGRRVDQAVLMPIPRAFTETEKTAALRRMVERTKAYGIALVEKKGNALCVLFETHHGARAWLTPLERHGDIWVPGDTVVRDNAECLGLLWQPRRGQS